MSAKWFVVVAYLDDNLPTLLIGPRKTERAARKLGEAVDAGEHLPKEYAKELYDWNAVNVRGIKA